jgi:hypothetical protein
LENDVEGWLNFYTMLIVIATNVYYLASYTEKKFPKINGLDRKNLV